MVEIFSRSGIRRDGRSRNSVMKSWPSVSSSSQERLWSSFGCFDCGFLVGFGVDLGWVLVELEGLGVEFWVLLSFLMELLMMVELVFLGLMRGLVWFFDSKVSFFLGLGSACVSASSWSVEDVSVFWVFELEMSFFLRFGSSSCSSSSSSLPEAKLFFVPKVSAFGELELDVSFFLGLGSCSLLEVEL